MSVKETDSPNTFDVTKPASSTIPASPLANVQSGASRTEGSASGDTSHVNSFGGSVIADVLPGAAPGPASVVQAATGISSAAVSCQDPPTTTSHVDLLVIGGSPVPVADEPTTIIVPGLPLIVANARSASCDASTRTCSASALALEIQAVTTGQVVDLKYSGANAKLENLPLSCPAFTVPILTNSLKVGAITNDVNQNGLSDAGDQITWTVTARNTGAVDGTNLVIVDRLPTNFTLDPNSVVFDGAPVTASVANCPGDVSFGDTCPGEQPIDTSRQCLTVQNGTLPAGPVDQPGKVLTFSGTATDSASLCNAAFIKVDNAETVVRPGIVPGSNGGTPTPGTPTPGTQTPGTPTPGIPTATPTPGGPSVTETPGNGGGDDEGGNGLGKGKCASNQGGVIRVVDSADPVIPPSSTGSGGAIVFSHTCTGASLRVQSVTLGLSGHPEVLKSITATGLSRAKTQTVTVSPVGQTAVFNFNPPLLANVHETADLTFSLATAPVATAGQTVLFASLFPGGMTPFGAGLAFLAAGIVLLPVRAQKRALGVLLFGFLAVASSPIACGGDGGSQRIAPNAVTLQVVQVVALDGTNKPIRILSGLPAMLGTVSVE